MAGVSKLTRAKSMALLALQCVPPEFKREEMQVAKDRVYALYRAATDMRGAYKTNKSARESVKHTQESAWELSELLETALEHWPEVNQPQVAVLAFAAMQHMDTMDANDQAMVDSAMEKLRSILPRRERKPQLTNTNIAVSDPEDRL